MIALAPAPSRMSTSRCRVHLTVGLVVLTMVVSPAVSAAQVEVSAGMVVVPDASLGGTQVGPALSVAGMRDMLGLPLFLELGAARTDFTSLGQDYHHQHYLLAIGAAVPLTRGRTRLGLRIGLGAYGELETVEGDPSSPGGGGWAETIVPSLLLERELGGGKQLVVRLTDAIVGPWSALLDSTENSIDHRLLLVLGIRF